MKSTLMIKDLALDKQLDRKSMSAVRGGAGTNQDQTASNQQANFAAALGGNFGSPATAVVVGGPQINTQTQFSLSALPASPYYSPYMC
jgi:hypothetical protein